ncbi:hypothetical protein UFOVP536_43 [uncultured Caudovirales phage]|uniref:Uncharacterized protein n=1 Tax=uncultured Caudovirales phage TaxID=2100421 RepID=A0A6J5MSW8_9CAUD|nr:hypothetical protein UFOVP536_43 [uncultured Caudovirales phage]
MSKIIKVVVKNVIEFEVDDNFVMSNYDKANFKALAKKAVMQIPQSGLMNDAKYKIK